VIVVDASVVANVVADDAESGHVARVRVEEAGDVAAPDLVDVETTSVLRRAWLRGGLSEERFAAAIDDLLAFPIRRWPTRDLIPRAFELRANVSAHHACYVALAEALDCPLLTADARLASAPTIRCDVEVISL
jgi:predicted nucleic acid-binding protein